MSDGQKHFILTYAYIMHWIITAVVYLIFVGINQLINLAFNFNQNVWVVSFIVLFIWLTHIHAKKNANDSLEKMKEEGNL